jgi:hypothetical protein
MTTRPTIEDARAFVAELAAEQLTAIGVDAPAAERDARAIAAGLPEDWHERGYHLTRVGLTLAGRGAGYDADRAETIGAHAAEQLFLKFYPPDPATHRPLVGLTLPSSHAGEV